MLGRRASQVLHWQARALGPAIMMPVIRRGRLGPHVSQLGRDTVWPGLPDAARRRAGRTRKWPNPGVDEELGRRTAPRLWPGLADSYRDFKPELQLQV